LFNSLINNALRCPDKRSDAGKDREDEMATTNQAVPKSGKAVPMRNQRTGAAWLVSFNHIEGMYWHEPQGNLRHIRQPFAAPSIQPHLVPAGTH